MYLCICSNVTEQELVEAIDANEWQTIKEVQAGLSVGKRCGMCVKRCKELLQEVDI